MSAIITDQLRILNAKSFVNELTNNGSYYAFIGLSNATDYFPTWDTNPPAPRDSFEQENDYWDTMVALKRIGPDDVRQMVRKVTWSSATTYDMYRHDISRTNTSKPSGATSLYYANYYVINSDFRVYICLNNGVSPETPNGSPSLDEPTFTDLEPRPAGNSGDGYIWKYLYTIRPRDVIKFDSTEYMPVPIDWFTNQTDFAVRNNAETSGQLKVVTITNRGSGVGDPNRVYTNVPIRGDGSGATVTIVVGNDSAVQSVTLTNGGSGYTYGTVDLQAGGVPTASVSPTFNVIIPPTGGHGADIYKELGAFNVLVYSRIENDDENPDFIIDNKIARIGIVENPLAFDSTATLDLQKASSVYALKLVGAAYSTTTFTANGTITQTVGTGQTAVGRVFSYNQNTGVLKYWQDKTSVGFNTSGTISTSTPQYGYNLNRFSSSGGAIEGGSSNLSIDAGFTGISTTINNRNYYLGQLFTSGVSNPEVQKYSGNIIYVDNRPSITRSQNQKEDIKIILQF